MQSKCSLQIDFVILQDLQFFFLKFWDPKHKNQIEIGIRKLIILT